MLNLKAFQLDIDSLTEEEAYNYLRRYYEAYFKEHLLTEAYEKRDFYAMLEALTNVIP